MYQSILIPLDGSIFSDAAIAHLDHIAGAESDVILLHVVDTGVETVPFASSSESTPVPPIAPSLAARAAVADRSVKAFADAEAHLQAKADMIRGQVKSVRTVVMGDSNPATTISTVAQAEKVNLILMSTHGRSGVVRWLLGSVAEKVVRSTDTPILLIRPDRLTA